MKLLQGKVKTVFETDNAEEVMIEYHDKVTAGNGKKEDFPAGKGSLCCQISSILFDKLSDLGIRNHYISQYGPNKMLCKKVDIIPLEVICRNRAAGSIVKTTTIAEGQPMIPAIVEFFLKDDSKHDPLLTRDRVRLMGYDPSPLVEQTHLINDYLLNIFNLCGLDFIDFKIEYGIDPHGDLLLADEISPDCMRLWGKTDQERYDKDLFRMDEGDVIPAYKTILDKLQATFV
jgi:phosphoribosylaminoimidazole-succinocarboxamide synthase